MEIVKRYSPKRFLCDFGIKYFDNERFTDSENKTKTLNGYYIVKGSFDSSLPFIIKEGCETIEEAESLLIKEMIKSINKRQREMKKEIKELNEFLPEVTNSKNLERYLISK